MALVSLSDIDQKTTLRYSRRLREKSAASILESQEEEHGLDAEFDVFLSHSYQDAKLNKERLLGLKGFLEEFQLKVYVDWLIDKYLDREQVTANTARILRVRMDRSKCLLFATSENSQVSKWMPWELGYMDGKKGMVAILPLATTSGQTTKEYQEHEGAKDGSTLYVGYNYDTTAASGEYTKGLRPTSVRYPNARLVHLTYGSSGATGDATARVEAINDDSSGSPGSSFSEYTHLGSGTIVVEDYTQPDVKLNYDSGTAGEYAGFDRFGRVVDHLWRDYGASADRDRFTYGYDRASSRLYRENTVASAKDEHYAYDDVNRLTVFDRGDLNANKDAISGTPAKEEDWTLDMTGNWSDVLQKTSGSTDLDQDRTHNPVNEITAITESTGTAWVDPVHDQAGNMTTLPKPSSLATGLTCTWDAWNRLVEVKEGEVVVARNEYDGLGRRAKAHRDAQSPSGPNVSVHQNHC